jgi:glycosyltransferase involved in cell wall biosynthesis
MNIGIVSEYFPRSQAVEIRGGAEARAFYIAKNLAKNNKVTVITSREPEMNASDEFLGMSVLRVGKIRAYSQSGALMGRLSFMREAARIGKQHRFDIVEGSSLLSCPAAWQIGEHLGIRRVCTYHDVWLGEWVKNIGPAGILGEILERRILSRKWDLIIANSQYTKNKLMRAGVDQNKIQVIHNGVELSRYREIEVPKSAQPTVCVVARLVKYKRVDDAIKAVHRCAADIPDIRLKIIGTGPEESRLKSLVAELGLEKSVEFLGFVERFEDVVRTMKASRVLVLPSVVEGFGMVVIEAMAAGLPYIAADIPAVREATDGGMGGLLYEPANHEQLAANMKKVLLDDALTKTLLDQSERRVRQLEWGAISENVEAALKSVVGGR